MTGATLSLLPLAGSLDKKGRLPDLMTQPPGTVPTPACGSRPHAWAARPHAAGAHGGRQPPRPHGHAPPQSDMAHFALPHAGAGVRLVGRQGAERVGGCLPTQGSDEKLNGPHAPHMSDHDRVMTG